MRAPTLPPRRLPRSSQPPDDFFFRNGDGPDRRDLLVTCTKCHASGTAAVQGRRVRVSGLPAYSAQDRHIDDLRAAHTAWTTAEVEARRSGIWGPANDARGKFRRLQGRPKADPAPLHAGCTGRLSFVDVRRDEPPRPHVPPWKRPHIPSLFPFDIPTNTMPPPAGWEEDL